MRCYEGPAYPAHHLGAQTPVSRRLPGVRYHHFVGASLNMVFNVLINIHICVCVSVCVCVWCALLQVLHGVFLLSFSGEGLAKQLMSHYVVNARSGGHADFQSSHVVGAGDSTFYFKWAMDLVCPTCFGPAFFTSDLSLYFFH